MYPFIYNGITTWCQKYFDYDIHVSEDSLMFHLLFGGDKLKMDEGHFKQPPEMDFSQEGIYIFMK